MSMATPNLDRWHAELAAGERTPLDFDPLWRAACQEMHTLEAPAPPTRPAVATVKRLAGGWDRLGTGGAIAGGWGAAA